MKWTGMAIPLLFVPGILPAQQATYLPDADTAFLRGNAAVFGDFINRGTLITHGDTLYIYGQRWENSLQSALPGDGIFYFGGGSRQNITGGYRHDEDIGPSFPNIDIANQQGVYLADRQDLHIRSRLHFTKGHLYLNDNDLLVDDAITGYTEKQFVVTGENIGGGKLYRIFHHQPLLTFPLGTSAASYSPLALQFHDDERKETGAGVFNHVYKQAVTGAWLDSTRVTKTWELTTPPAAGPVTVFLQHDRQDEGVIFSAKRDSSFIAVYHRDSAAWDNESPGDKVIHAGRLTTGPYILNAYTQYRKVNFKGSDSIHWLSIAVNDNNLGCPLLRFHLWKAVRYNYKWVQVFWRTEYEIHVKTYQLQVRRDTAVQFVTLARIGSQSGAAAVNGLLYYYFEDQNNYDGISYYRLKIVSPGGCVTYSQEQAVGPGFDIEVWPNPASDHLSIKIHGNHDPLFAALVNTAGKIVRRETIVRDGNIDVHNLPDGTYYLVVRKGEESHQVLTARKIIIQHAY